MPVMRGETGWFKGVPVRLCVLQERQHDFYAPLVVRRLVVCKVKALRVVLHCIQEAQVLWKRGSGGEVLGDCASPLHTQEVLG